MGGGGMRCKTNPTWRPSGTNGQGSLGPSERDARRAMRRSFGSWLATAGTPLKLPRWSAFPKVKWMSSCAAA